MANYYNKDLYKILNLTFEATEKEIKASYRKLVRIYHPDVAKNKTEADKFKEIQEAYEILSDSAAKRKYDILHGFFKEKIKKETQQKVQNKYEEFVKKKKTESKKSTSFSDSINEAIDNLFGSKRELPVNGDDITVDIEINQLEAINGTTRKINILHTKPCPNCNGHKFINGSICSMCNGTGVISIEKKINAKIPKGVYQGSKICIKKEGNAGLLGGKNGDLYLNININKNSEFEIKGLNILYNLPVSPFEAVLGAQVHIKTLTGELLNVKIPPMTNSGQKLRLANQGLQNDKKEFGDIIITVQIQIPKHLSQEEKRLYEKLQNCSGCGVRKDLNDGK